MFCACTNTVCFAVLPRASHVIVTLYAAEYSGMPRPAHFLMSKTVISFAIGKQSLHSYDVCDKCYKFAVLRQKQRQPHCEWTQKVTQKTQKLQPPKGLYKVHTVQWRKMKADMIETDVIAKVPFQRTLNIVQCILCHVIKVVCAVSRKRMRSMKTRFQPVHSHVCGEHPHISLAIVILLSDSFAMIFAIIFRRNLVRDATYLGACHLDRCRCASNGTTADARNFLISLFAEHPLSEGEKNGKQRNCTLSSHRSNVLFRASFSLCRFHRRPICNVAAALHTNPLGTIRAQWTQIRITNLFTIRFHSALSSSAPASA